jgi:hypothetical protein
MMSSESAATAAAGRCRSLGSFVIAGASRSISSGLTLASSKAWRARVVGVYRFWRGLRLRPRRSDRGIGADATSTQTAILISALLTGASGLLVAATSWQPTHALRPASAP